MRIGDPEHNRRVYGDKYDADSEAAIRKDWWEKPGRMDDLERRFKPDGLLRLARSTQEYYDSHGHYLPGVAVLAMKYQAELAAAREINAKLLLLNAQHIERERVLREALRERDYALRRIATTGDEVSNPAEWMRGIARSALDAAGEQA